MNLQFDANQAYQLEAVQSVVDIFNGQPIQSGNFAAVTEGNQSILDLGQRVQLSIENTATISNRFLIDADQITENVQAVQLRNSLPISHSGGTNQIVAVAGIEQRSQNLLLEGLNFTVEMETGTGKTYVYLRTIHELYQRYGFKKFIIVVPSLAIKEGVLKNLEITKEHFGSLYNNPKMDYYVWNPKKRGLARQFATNDSLQIMVLTIDSFTRNENVIRQASDWGVPMEFIRATNPIVLMDEPQSMETDTRRDAIKQLNPLCTLRYSATHRYPYNMVYKLDPIKAYNLGLVKRIEVDSVLAANTYNEAYVRVLKIEHKTKSLPVARIELDRDSGRGLERKEMKVEPGDDLERLTHREAYAGYVVDTVSAADKFITFTNGKKLRVGEANEALADELAKFQIRRTIEDHFEKELFLKDRGIKVLSLFFVDAVANYREYTASGPTKGKFAQWFEESYREVQAKPEYAGLIPYAADQVHKGYFSIDKNKNWKDTKGETAADDDTYELIMKEKERLLDSNEPARFIFSHSALKEGWDNPNVFQICTLREMSKAVERRQTIGRGLRLPVNSQGERVRDESINILTVVANEGYQSFAEKLQQEMEEQTGITFEPGQIKEKPKRRVAKLRKNVLLNEDFQKLWEKIKHKTRYHVTFDTEVLIKQVCAVIEDEVVIRAPKITSTTAILEMSNEEGIRGKETQANAIGVTQEFPTPDVLGKITESTGITRKTVYEILSRSGLIEDILRNPQQVIDEVTRVIKVVLEQLNVDGIKYEKTGEVWEMQQFENDELSGYLFDEATKQGLIAVEDNKTTHNYVAVDSDIEKEYLEALESNSAVSFYCKLPSWFKIDTPLGGYNPDWAVVFDGDERIYFVSETKAENTLSGGHLTDIEKRKIRSARDHFKTIGVEYIAPTNSFKDTLNRIEG